MNRRVVAWSAIALSSWFLTAGVARAADIPLCSELAASLNAQPIYVAGTSSAEPLIRRISAQLLVKKQYAVFYQPSSSTCSATKMITVDLDKTKCDDGRCLTGTAVNAYFGDESQADSSIATRTCLLDPAGTHVDIALSDFHFETCMNAALPSTLASHRGPAVAMNFAVSTQQRRAYISDAEAYSVFGLSCGGGVSPWTDSQAHFIPSRDSGVTQLLSRAIGVPANQMWGFEPPHPDGVSTEVAVREALRNADAKRNQAIALLPSSILEDAPASELKALAFRARGQRYAFAPDVDRLAGDKKNVRNGRYVPFGYLHLFLRRLDVTAAGAPRFFFELFTGVSTIEAFDLREAMIKAHYIPACAMKVKRTSERIDERGYFVDLKLVDADDLKPTGECTCFFEYKASGVVPVSTDCVQCTKNEECAVRGDSSATCVDGFCAGLGR